MHLNRTVCSRLLTFHSVNEPFRVTKIAGARLLKNDPLDALDAVVADYRDLANHAYVTSSQHSVAKSARTWCDEVSVHRQCVRYDEE